MVPHQQLLGHETHELLRLRAVLQIRPHPDALVLVPAIKTLAALHLQLKEALRGLWIAVHISARSVYFSGVLDWKGAGKAVYGRVLFIIFVSFAFVVRLFLLAASTGLRLLSLKYNSVCC